MWFAFALLSAFLLGCKDAFNKSALLRNALVPTIFFNSLFCSLFLLFYLFLSEPIDPLMDRIVHLDNQMHYQIILKSVLTAMSWVFIDSAIKNLPLTISSPVKAFQPIVVLIGAMLLFSERLNMFQWAGVALSIPPFLALSRTADSKHKANVQNKWVGILLIGIVITAVSGLLDKYLINKSDIMVIMFCNYMYMTLFLGLFFIVRRFFFEVGTFVWKWQIPVVALLIFASDLMYFFALNEPNSLVSVILLVRRASILFSFVFGIFFFKERDLKKKLISLSFIVVSIFLLYIGTLKR